MKLLASLAVLSGLLFVSCGKEDSKVKTKQDMLTEGKWRMTESKLCVATSNSRGTTCDTSSEMDLFPDCRKDDLLVFEANGSITTDYASLKCFPAEPRTNTTGHWALKQEDSRLEMIGQNSPATTFQVLEMTQSTMRLLFDTSYVMNGETLHVQHPITFTNTK